VTFTAAGSPKAIADRIEQCAVAEGNLTALVVPWESDGASLNMAVTAVKGDGWAIEHTNLGTITLRPAGENATSVTIAADQPEHPEKRQLAAVFERFAERVQQTVRAGS
jgi:hypothetical protein